MLCLRANNSSVHYYKDSHQQMKSLPNVLVLSLLLSFTITLHIHWHQATHDHSCYTQGLSFINQTHILQSCGLYNQSYFQIYHYQPNHSVFPIAYKSRIFPSKYFLEGSVLFPKNNAIYILTWRENVVLRYSYTNQSNDFKWMSPLKWAYSGWGLTHNNTHLFASDGSDRLFICDEEMKLLQTLHIVDTFGNRLFQINELEWASEGGQQYIYANIYMQTTIVKINIRESKVVERIDLSQLRQKELQKNSIAYDQVLNGIAIKGNSMVVTGKKWTSFFIQETNHDL